MSRHPTEAVTPVAVAAAAREPFSPCDMVAKVSGEGKMDGTGTEDGEAMSGLRSSSLGADSWVWVTK